MENGYEMSNEKSIPEFLSDVPMFSWDEYSRLEEKVAKTPSQKGRISFNNGFFKESVDAYVIGIVDTDDYMVFMYSTNLTNGYISNLDVLELSEIVKYEKIEDYNKK